MSTITDARNHLDLRYLGRLEGQYVLEEARKVQKKARDLEKYISLKNVTPAFVSNHVDDDYDIDHWEAKGIATVVQKTYIEIYETLANRIGKSVNQPLRCLPNLAHWLGGTEYFIAPRDWRNQCAHQAGVPLPFEYDESNSLFNRGFDGQAFMTWVNENLPLLTEELDIFISLLANDIDNFEVIDYTPVPNQVAINEQRAQQLLDEGNLEIVAFHDRQKALLDLAQNLEHLRDFIESGDLNLRQKLAAALVKLFDRTRQDAIDEANIVHAKKIARAEEIFKELANEPSTPWETEDTYNDQEVVGGWDKPDFVEPSWTVPDNTTAVDQAQGEYFLAEEGSEQNESETEEVSEQGESETSNSIWGPADAIDDPAALNNDHYSLYDGSR